ncbi:MAG: SGNH/GDSL hydrolase family protein [Nitrospira sp.]|nr:SGNH/GDSL hydrolase family protein [Nitrospira sp.]MDH4250437.1 SGNH/GDSL hydrolase family protein [Nitrospira sp.]MDH4343858.1 SGNH/GDSL hydrolase family protein [Nitrospira sp.]MDH5336919.1 SGNH/GDSL hydrolase family protein [Nitrospira sp.]
MRPRLSLALSFLTLILVPALAFAQVNFPKKSYYVGMGDSVAAGEGAMPVTNGYVYRLYDQSAFGKKQEMDFANIGIRGGRSWDLRDHQASQVLCAEPEQRPTVVTITAGANDFFRNDFDVVSSAKRVAQAVDLLLNNDGVLSPNLGATSVLDPVTNQKCRALQNVTILVSNYYIIPHPVPEVFQLLNTAVQGFNEALGFLVLQQVVVPTGSRIAVVDLYTPSLGRQGLVTIDRRLGYTGPFDFDIHPTNLGHTFIAGEFKKVWNSLP